MIKKMVIATIIGVVASYGIAIGGALAINALKKERELSENKAELTIVKTKNWTQMLDREKLEKELKEFEDKNFKVTEC